MRAIRFLELARVDFDQSLDWYASKSVVAAARFLAAVDVPVNKVGSDPQRFPYVDSLHQECSVKRFPFRIIFRTYDEHVLVVAIAHAKRRPSYWQERT